MKKQRPVGLVVEGSTSNSALLRLRKFGTQIGPVKSSSLGAARRFSNANRAGYAVGSFAELQNSRLILVRVPDHALSRIVRELADSGMDLKRKSIAFCETWFGSEAMAALRERGAAVATLTAVPAVTGPAFVAEGDGRAMRLTKQVVEGGSGEFLQIDPGTKSLYFAAELLATAMPVFYLNAAEKTLRSAGISGRPLASLLDQLGARMLRNCRAGTRISGGGPLASCPSDLAELYLKTAAAELPAIASLLGHSEEYELKSAIQNGLEPLVCHTQVKHAEALSMEIEAARD